MRLRKRTLAALGMKILGKGLLKMAEDTENKDNVVEIDPGEAVKVRDMIADIKSLLEIKSRDFAKQFVNGRDECPEYMVDGDFGVQLVEVQLADCFNAEDWDNDDLLGIAANAFGLVVLDLIAEHYGIEAEDEED